MYARSACACTREMQPDWRRALAGFYETYLRFNYLHVYCFILIKSDRPQTSLEHTAAVGVLCARTATAAATNLCVCVCLFVRLGWVVFFPPLYMRDVNACVCVQRMLMYIIIWHNMHMRHSALLYLAGVLFLRPENPACKHTHSILYSHL